MKIFYRISDRSYPKIKLPGTNKKICLDNFIKIFHDYEIKILADNCENSTLDYLESTNLSIERTNLGNAGALKYAIELSFLENPEEIIYFVEDDYLHLPQAPKILQEGILLGDYVTIYDHPDKYTVVYNGGEISKVLRTQSSHWRYTISTCMTFATKVKTIQEDYTIWEKYISDAHPDDHSIFTELKEQKNRQLILSIPGVACHTDLTFSGQMNSVLIDDWALDMMIDYLNKQIPDEMKCLIKEQDKWKLLKQLDAFYCHVKKNRRDVTPAY